uniref:Uncharacterized protein n=1 Tax=Rhizophora mucronata TaxID=61149 RepID=A0A2P2QAF1_RHIMU
MDQMRFGLITRKNIVWSCKQLWILTQGSEM